MDLEKTLVLIKPDGVERGLIGQIITRFENVGLKVIGLKLMTVDAEFAKQHYTEDLTQRRGQVVRDNMVRMLSTGPVVAIALEGVESIELVRKMVGPTEPKSAPPGTIRGDFAHVSYRHSDEVGTGIKNIVHASADPGDATSELALWFSPKELCDYPLLHAKHILS